MNTGNKIRAEIAGTGMFLPGKVLTNADLEKTLDTSDEWIRTRTGICERRIADDGESSSTFAIQAGRMALESARIQPNELDLIIVCTSTPDILFPATACFVQNGLGAVNAAAYDISALMESLEAKISELEQRAGSEGTLTQLRDQMQILENQTLQICQCHFVLS